MPCDVTWLDISDYSWIIARSFDEAVRLVFDNGFPDVISFDHDLGYEEEEVSQSGLVIVTKATEEKSGYDFAKWLIDYDLDTKSMPLEFKFYIHSKNPVGALNIKKLLGGYIKYKNSTQ